MRASSKSLSKSSAKEERNAAGTSASNLVDIEELRFVVDQAPVLLAHCDRECRYLFANRPYADRFGLVPEAIIGKTLAEVAGQAAYEAILPFVNRVLSGESIQFETLIPYKAIGPRYMDVRYVPRVEPSGEINSFVAAILDVTEKRNAQLLARRQQEAIEQTHDAIVMWKLGGNIVSWNGGAERLYGYTSLEATGQISHNLLQTRFPSSSSAADFEAALSVQGAWSGELYHQTKTGREVIVETRMVVIDGEFGAKLVIETNRDITERRQAEEALKRSQGYFRELASTVPVMLWVTDTDGSCTYLNDRWFEFTGQAEGEALGFGWLKAVHPEDAGEAEAAFLRSNRERKPFRVEYRLRRRDGKYRWAIDTAAPHFDSAGNYLGLVGTVIDITERKEAEVELRKSQERLQAALRSASAGTFRWNMRDDTAEFDEAMNRLFGLPEGGALYTLDGLLSSIHVEDRAEFLLRCRHCQETGCDFEMEYRVVWPDGSVHWIDDRGKVFNGPDGRPDYMTGACVDVSARKEGDQIVQQSRQRLDLAIRAADLGIWFCDLPFDVFHWDDKVKQHFWLPPNATVTVHTFYEKMHPDDRENTRLAIQRSIDQREMYDVEYRTLSEDGRVKCIRAIGRAYYNKNGNPIRFDGVTMDVSELAKARQTLAERGAELERLVDERTVSLQHAAAQMEEFSYAVSHDLRAPLRALRSYSELLLTEYGDKVDDNGKLFLQRINRAGERMEKLTSDVLALSRLNRGQVDLMPVSLDALVGDIIAEYPSLQVEAADLLVHTLHTVKAHEPSLAQALSNLLGNAVKFVPPGVRPRVEVESKEVGGKIRIFVRDNGIGIKPEYHARLFRMFERVHADSSYEGTGIGLTIAQKAMDRMGGKIGVESDGKRGTTFWLELDPA